MLEYYLYVIRLVLKRHWLYISKILKQSNILKTKIFLWHCNVIRLLCVKFVSREAAHNLNRTLRKLTRFSHCFMLVYIQKIASFKSILGNRSENSFSMPSFIRTVMHLNFGFMHKICVFIESAYRNFIHT